MKFDRAGFLLDYRHAFGALTSAQVDGIESLLDAVEADAAWETVSSELVVKQIAYFMATIKHESGDTWQPVREFGLGHGRPYGTTFYGRGYVQLTWQTNYERIGKLIGVPLSLSPDLALRRDFAYTIASRGMRAGWFTGRRLADYINENQCDFYNARRIINRLDRAGLIEALAHTLEEVLARANTPPPRIGGVSGAPSGQCLNPGCS